MTTQRPVTTTHSTPALAPEAVEEVALRARIDALRGDIAALAAELEELRTALAAFEVRYDARVGVLLVELDRVDLELTICRKRLAALRESAAAWSAVEAEIEQLFAAERERIGNEEQAARQAGERERELPPVPPEELAGALRRQYRKLARVFHPDVATTDAERAFNEAAMRRINSAMERHDLTSLETLEAQLPAHELDLHGVTTGARIAWATDEIARLEDVLARLTGELAAERSTSLHRLWQRVEQQPGLLERLAENVSSDLATRQMELHALTREYDDLAARASTLLARRQLPAAP